MRVVARLAAEDVGQAAAGMPMFMSEASAAAIAESGLRDGDLRTESERRVFASFLRRDGTLDRDRWMKAPNGIPTKLSPRQFVQVRTPEFKRWFGDWEARYYSQGWKDKTDPGAIRSLPAVDISGYAPLADKAAIAEAFATFGEVTNEHDGRKVRFPANVAGRMVFHKRTAAAFKELFEGSVRAWSEDETHFEGHKAHSNIRAYHQYVNKFTDADGEHFVRFTVREDNPGKGAQNNVHAAVVTNVELLEKASDSTLPDSSTGRSESPARDISPRADKKLALFLSDFKPENVSKIVDENGEPRVVYHGSSSEHPFTVFQHGVTPKFIESDPDVFWFFDDARSAEEYAAANGRVFQVFLNLRNPGSIDADAIAGLIEAGRDGVIGGDAGSVPRACPLPTWRSVSEAISLIGVSIARADRQLR